MAIAAPPDDRSRAAGRRRCALRLVSSAALAVVACGTPEAAEQDDTASIQAALERYAPRLADAYAVADLEALRAYAEEHAIEDPRVRDVLERYGELAGLPLRQRLETTLEGVAVEKEIAGLEKRVGDLLAEGRVIRPTPKSIVVEDVEVWRHTNSFATTVEVWDLLVYAAGTDVLLSETLDQRNRVRYQLQRQVSKRAGEAEGAGAVPAQGDTWIVLFRQLDAAFE